MIVNIKISIIKLLHFAEDERLLLVKYATLVSQKEEERIIVLYDTDLVAIIEHLDDDCPSDYMAGFKLILTSLLLLKADQYKFD